MIRLEIYGIIVVAFAVALMLSLVSFTPVTGHARPENWLGPVGHNIAELFLSGFGVGSFLLAVLFGWLGFAYIVGRRARMGRVDLLGGLLAFLSFIVLSGIIVPGRIYSLPASPPQGPNSGFDAGGAVGNLLRSLFEAMLSTPGTVLVFVALGLVSVVLLTRRSLVELARAAFGGGSRLVRWLIDLMRKGDADLEEEQDEGEDETQDDDEAASGLAPVPAAPTAHGLTEERQRQGAKADEGARVVERAPHASLGTAPAAVAAVPTGPATPKTTPSGSAPASAAPIVAAASTSTGTGPSPAPALPAAPEPDDGIRIVESEAMRKPPVIIESFDAL